MFSKEKINTGRQAAPDLYKAILALALAYVHVAIETAGEGGLDGGWNYFLDTIIGGPFGAPYFMFAMGIGMVYRRNHGTKTSATRGIKLFIAAFFLNAGRSLLPALLGYAATGDSEHYFSTLKYGLFGNDIMQFAGLAFLIMSIFEMHKLSKWWMFAISVLMSIAGTILVGFHTGNEDIDIVLGHFLPVETESELIMSDFPVLNWMIIVMAGYIFGTYLMRAENLNKFYGIVGIISAVIAIPYLATGVIFRRGMFGVDANCFYHLRIWDAFACMAIFLMAQSLLHFICNILPKACMNVITDISKNLNHIYIIHWVLIGFFVRFLLYTVKGTQETSIPVAFLIGMAISLSSAILAHFWGKASDRKKTQNA